MGSPIDITGQTFGRLTVLAKTPERNQRAIVWLCRCVCGSTLKVSGGHLRSGHTQSCGCLRAPPSMRKHGHSYQNGKATPEYETWSGMKSRCENPGSESFGYYGGRGIKVCDRWRDSFEAFLADMGPRPSRKHSIDRIDNDGDYEPGNCRWAAPVIQQRNKRSNHYVEFRGRRMTVTEAAEVAGVNIVLVRSRVKRGWPIERAVK